MEQTLTSIFYTFGDIVSYLSIAAFVALIIRKPTVRAIVGLALVLTASGQLLYIWGVCGVNFWFNSSFGWYFKLPLLAFSPFVLAIAAIRDGHWGSVGLGALVIIFAYIQRKIGERVVEKAMKRLTANEVEQVKELEEISDPYSIASDKPQRVEVFADEGPQSKSEHSSRDRNRVQLDIKFSFYIFIGIIVTLSLVKQTHMIFLLWLVLSVAIAIHLAGFTLCAFALRVPVDAIQLFFKPDMLSSSLGKTQVGIGINPTGGFVQIRGMAPGFVSKENERDYQKLSLLSKICILLSGCTALSILSILCIGSHNFFSFFSSGFVEIFEGALYPISRGQLLVGSLVRIISGNDLSFGIGVVSALLAAFNLIPFPSSNTGRIITEIFKLRDEKIQLRLQKIGVSLTLLLLAGWGVAICSYALSRL